MEADTSVTVPIFFPPDHAPYSGLLSADAFARVRPCIVGLEAISRQSKTWPIVAAPPEYSSGAALESVVTTGGMMTDSER